MNHQHKNCPFCDEEIRFNAVKCKHCGEFLDEDLHRESIEERQAIAYPVRKWHPGIAALLSLIIPGAGQIYKGNIGSGIAWLIFVGIGYAATVMLTVGIITAVIAPFTMIATFILHIICIISAASGNPYTESQSLKRGSLGQKEGTHPALIVAILLLAYIALKFLSGEW